MPARAKWPKSLRRIRRCLAASSAMSRFPALVASSATSGQANASMARPS
jgi:hypothetical protein